MLKKVTATFIFGLALIGSLSIASLAQAETTLRLLNAFDNRYPGTALIVNAYIDAVKTASKGDIRINTFGPEVVSPFEQLQPVRDGAFDLIHTNSAYYLGTTSVSHAAQAGYDPEKWRKAGLWDYIDRDFEKYNLKLISIVRSTTDPQRLGAYQFMLKEPAGPGDKPLEGRKIRGTPFYQQIIEGLGGSSVTLSGGDIYSSLQRGTIEGLVWPIVGPVGFKWYEVARYMVRPTFGDATLIVLMNRTKFNNLTAEQRAVLLAEGEKLEFSAPKGLEAAALQEIDELRKRGVQETTIDPKAVKFIEENLAKSVWQQAESSKASGQDAKAFHEFARSKGLAQ